MAWLQRTEFLFLRFDRSDEIKARCELPHGFSLEWWTQRHPADVPPGDVWQWRYMVWFVLFLLGRPLRAVVVRDAASGKVVHSSLIFPRYFRFPFMGPGDLQIGVVRTDPAFRGLGLARAALGAAVERFRPQADRIWWLVELDNSRSIHVARAAGFGHDRRGERVSVAFVPLLAVYRPGTNGEAASSARALSRSRAAEAVEPGRRRTRVWLITAGEPLPIDGSSPRLLRTGQLASALSQRGADIVWWTSTFDHTAKAFRSSQGERHRLTDRTEIITLHGRGYRRNVSLSRLINHWQIARAFERQAREEAVPDIVLCSWPTIRFALAARRFCGERHVPLVIDVRDLWPEVYVEVLPRLLRWPLQAGLRHLSRRAKSALRGADGVVSISEACLDWAYQFSGRRPRAGWDQVYYHSTDATAVGDEERGRALELWRNLGVGEDDRRRIVCFAGTMSRRIKLRAVVHAAKQLRARGRDDVVFVLCGAGEQRAALVREAGGAANVVFPGWVDRPAVRCLLERAALGLLPYPSTLDFVRLYPNKLGEYLSAGIPVLSCTKGVVAKLLEEERCGYHYQDDSGASLADAIEAALADPDELSRRRQNALRVFSDRFDARDVYKRYAEYLETAAASGSGREWGAGPQREGERESGARTRRGPAAPAVGARTALRIWILQTGEPLHVDAGHSRPLRAMNAANALVAAGHKVVVWSAAFYHQEKRHRARRAERVTISRDLEYRLIPSPGYVRNLGLARLWDHVVLGVNLRRLLVAEHAPPDACLIGYPPIETAAVMARWLKQRGAPSLLDVKDQWPQLFVDSFPGPARIPARIACIPYFRLARRAMRDATGLSAMADGFLQWALQFAGRPRGPFDAVVPLTSPRAAFTDEALRPAREWWKALGVDKDGRARFSFVGSHSRSFDFEPIVAAARQLAAANRGCQFVICGAGECSREWQDAAAGLSNIIFPGWVDAAQTRVLAEFTSAFLAPYKSTSNFERNIPNKVLDALSLGVPILTPLRGEVAGLIDAYGVGMRYGAETGRSLVDCLRTLESDEAMRRSMSANALALYERRFTYEKVYGELVARLEDLARVGARGR